MQLLFSAYGSESEYYGTVMTQYLGTLIYKMVLSHHSMFHLNITIYTKPALMKKYGKLKTW